MTVGAHVEASWQGPGTHAAQALLRQALELLRCTSPQEWRSTSAVGYLGELDRVCRAVAGAHAELGHASDALRRHHAELAAARAALAPWPGADPATALRGLPVGLP